MQTLNMILYTGIALGVLIFIHELGHFLAAKLCGMRVDRFSIGFPPRAFGKKIGETDYCISWVPLGGYVKIAGMVDESMDTEFLDKDPQPWEFRAKPMWARMFVISAGVIMNVLLAIIIFSTIHYLRGTYIKETTAIGYVAEGSAFQKAGLLAGDSILSINGKPVTHWDEIQNLIYIENLGNNITLQVDRQGTQASVFIPAQTIPSAIKDAPQDIFVAHTVTTIDVVEPHMPAEQVGLHVGDTLLTLDNEPAIYPQLISIIKAHAGRNITLTWKRNDRTMSGTTTVTKEGRIGILPQPKYIGRSKHISYTFVESVIEGAKEMGESVRLFILTIGKLFSGKTSFKESFGGPIAIAQMATQSAEIGLLMFLWFMAQISMSLAILNILPIPALDGGHLAILVYEKAARREIPHKVKITIQQAGFILLLAFMAFVIYNDISRF